MVRLDRFSPLFFDSHNMGVCNVRAGAAYRYVYPFAPGDLAQLAYYFDFDYADDRKPPEYLRDLRHQVSLWSEAASRAQLTAALDGDTLVICDTRAVAPQSEYRLRGLHRKVYEFCDTARTRSQLDGLAQNGVGGVLGELMEAKLILAEDDHYLSLAVDASYAMDIVARRYARRLQLSGLMRSALARFFDSRVPTLTSLFAARLATAITLPASFTVTDMKQEVTTLSAHGGNS
jgi:hypothetical protein